MSNLNCQDYLIITGGYQINNHLPNKKLLQLNCNDFYEGLPEKIHNTYTFIYQNDYFNNYKYICKLDDDMVINNLLYPHLLTPYGGIVNTMLYGNREWHIGKCSEDSKFNKHPYKGYYVPWCLGGYGYVISTKNLEFISKDTTYLDEIYEDLYIAKILFKHKIYPVHISKWTNFIQSPEHLELNQSKIQNVFFINLKERPDLLDKNQYIFKFIEDKYADIPISIIDAINLNQTPEIFNNLVLNGTISLFGNGFRKNPKNVLGEISCFLSHLKCWEKIVREKLLVTLILEDGMIFYPDKFRPIINSNNFDIIFTNDNMKNINNTLTGYGTQSYILSYKGAVKLLDTIKPLSMPIDLQLRELCNKRTLIWSTYHYFTTNDMDKKSSISHSVDIDVNQKQDRRTLMTRIITNLIESNINLADYL